MWSLALMGLFAAAESRLALTIGVNRTDDPAWPALRYAEKDATDVAQSLAGFASIPIDRPTKANVLAALDELDRRSTSPSDTVVVYFSAHGTLAYDARGVMHRVLVLADTLADDPLGTGLSHEELLERIDRVRSKRKLVLIASCHSGAGKSVLPPDVRAALRSLKGAFFRELPEIRGEGRVVLGASAWGEPAREDDQLQNDVYTHFFLEALRGFDLDGDGATTALEAHQYARQRTIEYTEGRQRPSVEAEIVGEDPIVLAGLRTRAGSPLVASWAAAFSGAQLMVDGVDKGALPGSYALPAGTHQIEVRRPGEGVLLAREVEVEADHTLVLEELPPEPEARRLEISLQMGFRGLRSERVEAGYLPERWVIGGAVSFRPLPKLALGVELGVTKMSQPIRLLEVDDEVPKALAELLLFDADVFSRYTVLRLGPASLEAFGRVGLVAGTRSFESPTVRVREQLVTAPLVGLGAAVSLAITEVVGLEVRAGLDVLVPTIESEPTPVLSDAYSVGLWVRP